MTKSNKLLTKFVTARSITWMELVKVLRVFGYKQIEGSGSRVKFDNGVAAHIINLHKPHPEKEVKAYALRQIREKLTEWGYI
ncbi:MAG: type II toxin-antitoxin system HicA family toxin [Gammaproteobacteria bacterium]|nr:type II toxin-antitoxin system HicA family toxin [Gammaproteobacteria bacterium]